MVFQKMNKHRQWRLFHHVRVAYGRRNWFERIGPLGSQPGRHMIKGTAGESEVGHRYLDILEYCLSCVLPPQLTPQLTPQLWQLAEVDTRSQYICLMHCKHLKLTL